MNSYHVRGVDPLDRLGYTYSHAYKMECFRPWGILHRDAYKLMSYLVKKANSADREDIIRVYYATDSKGKADPKHLETIMKHVTRMNDSKKTVKHIIEECEKWAEKLDKMVNDK